MTNFNKGLICGTRRYVGVYNRKYSRCQPREDTFEFTFDNCIRYETDTYDVVEIPIPDIITKACYITIAQALESDK